jgi:hypothetical protein
MSLETFLKPQLYQSAETDPEWYIKATMNSLNSFMQELEAKLSIPNQMITGTTIVPGTPPVPTPIAGPLAYFIPTFQRITYHEIKTAMFCGDGRQCFINLFNLFGTKFAMNFVTLQASPILQIAAVATIPTTTFQTCAIQLLKTAHSIGAAMNPDTFVNIESKMLSTAIATIPPITIPCAGAGLIPPGAFTGVITLNFSTVAF